jgi:hypothetical protein
MTSIRHLFFQSKFIYFIWLVIRVTSTLYLPCSVLNIFGNWLCGMVMWYRTIDHKFRMLFSVGALAVISLQCVWKMIFLIVRSVLLCRLSTIHSIYDHLFNARRIKTCLRYMVGTSRLPNSHLFYELWNSISRRALCQLCPSGYRYSGSMLSSYLWCFVEVEQYDHNVWIAALPTVLMSYECMPLDSTDVHLAARMRLSKLKAIVCINMPNTSRKWRYLVLLSYDSKS